MGIYSREKTPEVRVRAAEIEKWQIQMMETSKAVSVQLSTPKGRVF